MESLSEKRYKRSSIKDEIGIVNNRKFSKLLSK